MSRPADSSDVVMQTVMLAILAFAIVVALMYIHTDVHALREQVSECAEHTISGECK
jgi:hypothetical protein